MKITVSVIILMSMAALSSAAELKLGKAYIAGGICGKSDVRIRQVEDRLIVSLDRFGLNLPSGSGAGLSRVTCNVRVPVTLPAGYRLRKLDGVVDGSIAKSRGADVTLTLGASIGTIATANRIEFAKGSELGAGPIQEAFFAAPRFDFDGACKRQDILGIDAKWVVLRSSTSDYVFTYGDPRDLSGLRSEYRIVLEPCR